MSQSAARQARRVLDKRVAREIAKAVVSHETRLVELEAGMALVAQAIQQMTRALEQHGIVVRRTESGLVVVGSGGPR